MIVLELLAFWAAIEPNTGIQWSRFSEIVIPEVDDEDIEENEFDTDSENETDGE